MASSASLSRAFCWSVFSLRRTLNLVSVLGLCLGFLPSRTFWRIFLGGRGFFEVNLKFKANYIEMAKILKMLLRTLFFVTWVHRFIWNQH